jgi:DMSO reductase anchor subunit
METAMTELPLALFTTLAPIGAGAFITLAIAFFTTKFSDERLKRIDRMTLIPFIIVIIGLVASFIHLASPLRAFGVFAGVGSSPLSNEIVVSSVFIIVSIIYLIYALTGNMKEGVRKGFIAVLAILAVVFACFTGMAYMVNTIGSWMTPALPVSIIGFSLMGGVLLGALVLAGAGALDEACDTSFKTVALIVALIGLALGVIGVLMQYGLAASIVTAIANGASMASAVTGYLVAFVVCAALGVILGVYVLAKKHSLALTIIGSVLIIGGVFLARLVFYALQISVGL